MSVELVEVEIPFAGIEAIEVEVVNSVGAQGPPGTPYTEPTDTKPTDRTKIWVTEANVRCIHHDNDTWVAIADAAPETPESIVAKLADKDIDVASIQLADATGLALSAGSVSLNASNQVVVHDENSNAEDLPHLVDSKQVINFAAFVPAASMDNVTYTRLLAEIPLTAADVANGKYLHLVGKIQATFPNAGTKANGGYFLVLCAEGQDPETEGMYFNLAEGVTSEERSVNMSLLFSVAAGAWTLANFFAGQPQCIIRKNSAGTITHDQGWIDGTDCGGLTTITGTAATPTKLQLHLLTIDTSDTVTVNMLVSGNLSAISQ